MTKRIFFPENRTKPATEYFDPFLRQAAEKLVEIATQDDSRTLDMSSFTCVVSGNRAKRTLTAYLAKTVGEAIDAKRLDADWIPPDVLLLGETPEKLYDAEKVYGRPLPIANEIAKIYCESRALKTFLTDSRFRNDALALFPVAEGADVAARFEALVADQKNALKLAQTFLSLDQNLANERKNCHDVAEVCQEQGLVNEVKRWRAVGKLHDLYLEELRRCGRFDRNDAREKAIKNGQIGGTEYDRVGNGSRSYFVIGAVDLNQQQKDIFQALEDRVQYWVYAPLSRNGEVENKKENEDSQDAQNPQTSQSSDGPKNTPKSTFKHDFNERPGEFFDEFGCVNPKRWTFDANPTPIIPIPDENVFLVDSPEDQGKAVALLARELSLKEGVETPASADDYERVEAERLVVGAPDLEVVPFVEERMKELGYATIHGEGSPIAQNRVFRVLELFTRYLETRSFDVLGEILRRPDVELWLRRVWNRYELPKASDSKNDDPEEARQREEDAALAADEDDALSEQADYGDPDSNVETEEVDARARWLDDFDEYRETFLPTRVGSRWFKKIDKENSKRNRYYLHLRKASHIIDETLAEFLDKKGSAWLYNSAAKRDKSDAKRDAFDSETDDLDALKIDPTLIGKLLVGNVEYATFQKKRPLAEWTEPIQKLVGAIYPSDVTRPDFDEESQIEGFSKFFRDALDALYRVPSKDERGVPLRDVDVTGAFAIRTLLSEIRGKSVAPTPDQNVVEIQGWLDLLFDDTPYCILTGFNERVVPSTLSGDMFLPNETRKALGLSDASRVFARDAYIAYTLACSRDAFFVVLEKRSLQKDPRLPSRFLFAADDEKIPDRVVRYFGEDGLNNFKNLAKRHDGVPFPQADAKEPTRGESKGFVPPKLNLPPDSPRSWNKDAKGGAFVMNVTDFEKFLGSPYRFFLEKALRLRPATRGANELDAANFGTLAHDVLCEFGKNERIRNATDEYAIFEWLSKRLDERAAESFNDYASPFVRVQIEDLRARLRSFSAWQAKWRKSGYEIREVERSATVELGVDERGRTTKVYGRLDRVDYNPDVDRWIVFDYKTFDSADVGSKNAEREEGGGIKDRLTGATLFTRRVGSVVDKKHRQKVGEGEPNYPSSFAQTYPNEDLDAIFEKRWINLQLPLYRHMLSQIVGQTKDDFDGASLGYVVLTPTDVKAYGAPWTSDELKGADRMARWVVEQIWKICDRGWVDPRETLDGFLPVLCGEKQNFDDFAPITLSYLDEN